MSPIEFAKHPNRKIGCEHFGMIRIVMTDRRNTAEEIAKTTPPKARRFGNRAELADRRLIRTIDIVDPFLKVRVGGFTAQAREEAEFEMIVSVDDPREQ